MVTAGMDRGWRGLVYWIEVVWIIYINQDGIAKMARLTR